MTRKDYVMVAAVLRQELAEYVPSRATVADAVAAENALLHATVRLADAFEADNPRFDRDRFTKAVTT